MVEDINNILNSGDVPNLYNVEDQENISTACRPDVLKKRLPPTKINIMSAYLSRVKKNIHCVLCFSPMGDAFRNRLRMFPALSNCTTIDWFSEWPSEALQSVGLRAITQGGKEGDKDPLSLGDTLMGVVEFFKAAHQTIAASSATYASERKRYNYVTPTSYLELLSTFQSVLVRKREEVGTMRSRLQTGLDKIISTEGIVSSLQAEILRMEPILADTQTKVAAMILQIDADKASAAETKIVVAAEEASANQMAAETKAIADDAQKDLDEALPALAAAVDCLNKLKKNDITEVSSMGNPPKMVKVTLQATCIMFQVKPKLIADPDNLGKKIKDYWGSAKLELLNPQLLDRLKEFDKDSIPEAVIKEIEPMIQDPEFTFENVDKSSKACSGICLWVRAMHKYYYVAKNVEPKKAKLAAAQASLAETMAKLAVVQAQLKAVEDKIAVLEMNFKEANDKKLQLAADVKLATDRKGRADQLLGGLGGEKGRWTETVASLNVAYTNLIGDSLVASTAIAYMGAFTPDYRRDIFDALGAELTRLNIPNTKGATLISVLADPVTIRSWTLAGLPTDTHSRENGIIMARARRWPLLIDPQGQANRYIRNMGKDKSFAPNGLDILRMSDRKFLQGLENGIRFGKWVLVENVGEALDAALEPVLLRLVFKQGGSDMIRLGDSTIPYNSDFRLYLTSVLPNPHYAPETQVKVSLLNFTLTPKGLEDQMLGVFVLNEMPELEERKASLVVGNARNQAELVSIENRILYLLANSTGNILDDADLIATLSESKIKADAIGVAVAEAAKTEVEIDATRESFRAVAFRCVSTTSSSCVPPLNKVDGCYPPRPPPPPSPSFFFASFPAARRSFISASQICLSLTPCTSTVSLGLRTSLFAPSATRRSRRRKATRPSWSASSF